MKWNYTVYLVSSSGSGSEAEGKPLVWLAGGCFTVAQFTLIVRGKAGREVVGLIKDISFPQEPSFEKRMTSNTA